MYEVLFVMPNINNNGGINRVTSIIANALSTHLDYHVSILSLTKSKDELPYCYSKSICIDSLNIEYFNKKEIFRAAALLNKYFDSSYSGVIIADDIFMSLPIFLGVFLKCRNARYFCWSHGNFYRGKFLGPGWLAKQIAKIFFEKLILLTKEDKAYYEKSIHNAELVQIYNPAEDGFSEHTININSKKIISCGRLDKIKRFDLLLKAAKHVIENHKDWTWDIYGDGPEKDNLQHQINNYQLDNNVFLKGYVSNIKEIYPEYAFCVMTSDSEGLPMVMIESMSARLPIITFDFKCGPKDLIVDGYNGYIVPQGNLELLALRVEELINNSDTRKLFSENSLVNFDELDSKFVIQKWKRVIEN